jgi:tetrahydromethanopterin S-methyltransferase subunit B
MSDLDTPGLLTLLYGARAEVRAVKSHADRQHRLKVAEKIAEAMNDLNAAIEEMERSNDPQVPSAN